MGIDLVPSIFGKKEIKRIQFSREIIIGDYVINEIASICKDLGLKKNCILIVDETTDEIVGKKILKLLEKGGFRPKKFFAEKADMETVDKVKKQIEKSFIHKADFLIGIGGGKNIDIAKVVAYSLGKQFISVPTIASHDGIASSHASILVNNVKYSLKTNAPLAIIADTDIIKHSPSKFTIAGFGDTISNYTAVLDWKLGKIKNDEYYGDYAAKLSLLAANMMLRNAKKIKYQTEEGIRILLEALISSGAAMSIAGSSRPCSGSEHFFSHAIDALASQPNLHGKQCGVGTIIMAYLHKADWKKIKSALIDGGAPVSLSELGIKVKPQLLFKKMQELSKKRNRYTILDEISEEDFLNAGKATGVF